MAVVGKRRWALEAWHYVAEVAQVHNLFAQRHAELVPDGGAALLDEPPDIGGCGISLVHDEVPMRGRYASSPGHVTLQPRAIDQRASRPGDTVRHNVSAG